MRRPKARRLAVEPHPCPCAQSLLHRLDRRIGGMDPRSVVDAEKTYPFDATIARDPGPFGVPVELRSLVFSPNSVGGDFQNQLTVILRTIVEDLADCTAQRQ